MCENDLGALPSDRAVVPSASSPQAVSTVPASIPSAGQWAVVNSGGDYFDAVLIDAVTPKLIKCRGYGRRMRQYARDAILVLFNNEEAAKQAVQALDGLRGSFRSARLKETNRHSDAMGAIKARQAAANRSQTQPASRRGAQVMAYSNRRKSDGSMLVTDKSMSRLEQYMWCAFYALIVGGGIVGSLYFGVS